jgi:hypothetical protein
MTEAESTITHHDDGLQTFFEKWKNSLISASKRAITHVCGCTGGLSMTKKIDFGDYVEPKGGRPDGSAQVPQITAAKRVANMSRKAGSAIRVA